MSDTEVCGSWRVVERLEGLEARIRWCDRVDGPCPFPGTAQSKDAAQDGDRRCGALPGKVLRVVYGEDKLVRARDELDAYAKRRIADGPPHPLHPDTAYAALDALRACLGDESS